jgi:glutaredoxin
MKARQGERERRRGPGGQQGAPRPAGARHLTAAALLGLVLLVVAGAGAAQVYKWTDAQGTVHYGDTPPPQQRTRQLKPTAPGGPARGAALPYELARAVKAHPVTLYTTTRSACGGCDQGRALLRARGIPYVERTVDSDADKEQLRQLTGKLELPLLVVGSRKVAGFQDAAWQEALTSAAYPRQAMLPSGYQYAAPEPAGGASLPAPPTRSKNAAPPDEAAAQAAEQQPRRPSARENLHDTAPAQQQPPSGNAPSNFQF